MILWQLSRFLCDNNYVYSKTQKDAHCYNNNNNEYYTAYHTEIQTRWSIYVMSNYDMSSILWHSDFSLINEIMRFFSISLSILRSETSCIFHHFESKESSVRNLTYTVIDLNLFSATSVFVNKQIHFSICQIKCQRNKNSMIKLKDSWFIMQLKPLIINCS